MRGWEDEEGEPQASTSPRVYIYCHLLLSKRPRTVVRRWSQSRWQGVWTGALHMVVHRDVSWAARWDSGGPLSTLACSCACTEEGAPFSGHPAGTVYSPRAVLTPRGGLILLHPKALPGLAAPLGLGSPGIVRWEGIPRSEGRQGGSPCGYRWLLAGGAIPEEQRRCVWK